MIRSFRDKMTRAIGEGQSPKGFPSDLIKAARRKLVMLDNAGELKDLATPPGNRLHALKDDRSGQHAISINDQFRICFRWENGGAEDVEIIDYH